MSSGRAFDKVRVAFQVAQAYPTAVPPVAELRSRFGLTQYMAERFAIEMKRARNLPQSPPPVPPRRPARVKAAAMVMDMPAPAGAAGPLMGRV